MLPAGKATVGRRGIKEYRPAEALNLIAADRDHRALACPSCGATNILREPKRYEQLSSRVTLTCEACGRTASYLLRSSVATPEEPRQK
jgi:transposase-like protein